MLRVPVSKEAIVMTLTILCILWRQTNGRVIEKETKALPIPEGVITQCRLSCLNKFSVETDSSNVLPQSCSSINHCMMCWDFCETLYIQKRTIFKSMCTNPTCVSINCNYFWIFLRA